eukprot:2078812-Rhodomonas_salina.1
MGQHTCSALTSPSTASNASNPSLPGSAILLFQYWGGIMLRIVHEYHRPYHATRTKTEHTPRTAAVRASTDLAQATGSSDQAVPEPYLVAAQPRSVPDTP